MTKLSGQVDSIAKKLNSILGGYTKLQETKRALEAENRALQAEKEHQSQLVADLQEQLKLIKITKSVSLTQTDNKELKTIIKEIIKEVDRCMAMLNN